MTPDEQEGVIDSAVASALAGELEHKGVLFGVPLSEWRAILHAAKQVDRAPGEYVRCLVAERDAAEAERDRTKETAAQAIDTVTQENSALAARVEALEKMLERARYAIDRARSWQRHRATTS